MNHFLARNFFCWYYQLCKTIIWHVMHKRVRNRKKWKVGRGLPPLYVWTPPHFNFCSIPRDCYNIIDTNLFNYRTGCKWTGSKIWLIAIRRDFNELMNERVSSFSTFVTFSEKLTFTLWYTKFCERTNWIISNWAHSNPLKFHSLYLPKGP